MGPLLRVAAAVAVLEDGREGPSRGHGATRWVAAAPGRPADWRMELRPPNESLHCRNDIPLGADKSSATNGEMVRPQD